MEELAATEQEYFCHICGWPLKQIEIAGEIYGTWIDFVTHDREPGASMIFCGECRANMISVLQGGITEARKRAERLKGEDGKYAGL